MVWDLAQTSECSEADRHGRDSEGRNSNTASLKRSKEKQKGTKKKTKMVKMIQNMVLGSIKFDSVSLFTIILSDSKF
jgi:hypothetical protein